MHLGAAGSTRRGGRGIADREYWQRLRPGAQGRYGMGASQNDRLHAMGIRRNLAHRLDGEERLD